MIFYFSGAETAGKLIPETLGDKAHVMLTFYKYYKPAKSKKRSQKKDTRHGKNKSR